jgi:hypothetical protein
MPGKFFDLPADLTCRNSAHFPPTGLYIPPGKGYMHTCPACGNTQTVVPTQVRMGAFTKLVSPASCWCGTCDTAANGGFRSRMSLCPECGDKRCPRAENHSWPCVPNPLRNRSQQ